MSLSTRESMRRELKELAKLAETMGKQAADVAAVGGEEPVVVAAEVLQRPPTPNGSSRVTVPPIATSTQVTPADVAESQRGSGKRRGVLAVLAGASLAAALVGGAVIGKSFFGNASAAGPAVDVGGAAAAMPPQPVAPTPVPPAAVPSPAARPVPDPAPISATEAAKGTSAGVAGVAAAPAAPAHKHVAPLAVAGANAKASAASNALPKAQVEPSAGPKAAAAASPGLSKPAAKAGAGGSDSLEDLIRKEVAAQKK